MRIASTLVLILAGAAAAQDNPALPVLKAAIEAHGGAEALGKARTARSSYSGTISYQGHELKFSATAVYAVPEKYHLEFVADDAGTKITITQILNGKKMKVVSKFNGTEMPADPKLKDETIQTVLLQEISTLTPLLDAKKYTVKLEKDAELNGNAAAVISVTGNGVKDVKLFFDRKSSRLVKTQRLASVKAGVEVNEETYLSDFKPFEKAILPTAMAVNHDGRKFMAMTVAEIKFADKIDEKEFAVD